MSSVIVNTEGAQDGYFGGASQGDIPGWIYQYDPSVSFPSISAIVASNQIGGWRAASFYARLSDAVAGGQNTIQPINDLCLADGAGLLSGYNTWCQYEQGNLTSTLPGFHINKESDLYSNWITAYSNPFAYNPLGHASVVRWTSGDGQHASPKTISSYAEMINNGAAAGTGLIVGNGALDTSSSQPTIFHIAPIIQSYPFTGYEWDSGQISGVPTMAARIAEYTVSGFPTILYDTAPNGSHEFAINGVPYISINASLMYPQNDNAFTLGASGFAYASIWSHLHQFVPSTIAALPTCNSASEGEVVFIKDTLGSGAATFHGAVAAGGSATVNSLASCSGSIWQYD